MKKLKLISWLGLFIAVAPAAVAHGLNISGKNEIFQNPFFAIGFNKSNNIVTGSISATRTAPGETNECRILFSGEENAENILKIRYFEVGAGEGVKKFSEIEHAAVIPEVSGLKLQLNKKNIGGDCGWLLDYVDASFIKPQGNNLLISVPKLKVGDWIGVYTIKSERAKFYKMPGGIGVQKAFLVAGDTIYVYEEKPDWYYVKFQGRKKQTTGWIKKSDTVQF